MTNDREKMTGDRSVSASYRELADERAPAGLDEKVLRRAAALPRARSGIGRAWMKPVAWAATIGLSLAIVLELTQLPQAPLDIDLQGADRLDVDKLAPPTDSRPTRAPASAPASAAPAAATETGGTKPSRHRSESGAVEESKAQAMAPTSAMIPADAQVQAVAPEQADVPVQADALAPEPAQPQVVESTDLRPLDDSDMAPEARSDEVVGTAAFAVRAKRTMLAQPALCPEKVREVAEDWYRCIEMQRNEASAPRVTRELEEFRTRFPDFQVSDEE